MKFKILTGYDGICPYRELAIANFGEYCERWGYELVSKFEEWGSSENLQLPPNVLLSALSSSETTVEMRSWLRRFYSTEFPESESHKKPLKFDRYWRKHQILSDELHDCDWLVWLDPDCVIMDMRVPLTRFIEPGRNIALTGPFHKCYCGAPVYSQGVIFLRCCDWTRKMLENWWQSRKVYWQQGINANCWTLADNNWLCCKFLREEDHLQYLTPIAPEVAGHYEMKSPDQFLIHLYGAGDQDRKTCIAGKQASIRR